MEIVTAIANNSGCIFSLVGSQFGYLTSYKSNLDKLRTQLRKLTADRIDMQQTVENARKNGENIAAAVQGWLDGAEVTIAGANKLINEDNDGHGEVRCLNWPFPNLCIRFKLSREAKEMAQKIYELIDDGRSFKRVSFPVPPQTITSSYARGYEALESRTSTLNQIKQALKDPNIYMIGVYGMGGVGKTTLVKELAWQAKKELSWQAEKEAFFDVVVMATITDTPNLRRIQGQLADGLDLKLEKETEEGRAGELRGRINQEKSILVILDNIWDELDFTELGVPHGDDHRGCKMVLTSRNRNVLNSKMGTQKDFILEELSEEESWNLFEKKASHAVKDNSIKAIAGKVAKRCAGLPLLIVTVAKALRGKGVSAWNDSLTRLEKSDHGGSLTEEVLNGLKLSYDYLESEELKSLFLLIGCFERDGVDAEEFLSICWGLGLYEGVGTFARARDRHYTLINDLRACSLLLERETDWVRMHDLVHDFARSIGFRTHPTYPVQRNTEREDQPKTDQLQKCHYVIVPRGYVGELPEQMDCRELKLLLVQNSDFHPLGVPENFFSGMREAKVLRLSGMNFTKTLPLSLRLLAKLRLLDLSRSVLKDIAMVGELTSLEILILFGARDLLMLPEEIGHLTRLRVLNFSKCQNLKFIATNVLSGLKCLEELYMWNYHTPCQINKRKTPYICSSLVELRSLEQLTTLELLCPCSSDFPWGLNNFANLERYNISIGREPVDVPKFSRTLILRDSSCANIVSNHGVRLLLTTVECLKLYEINTSKIWGDNVPAHSCTQNLTQLILYQCVGTTSLFPPSVARALEKLQYLDIFSCQTLEQIVVQDENQDQVILPNLETLVINKLDNLKLLWRGQLGSGSFCKLNSVKISQCPSMEKIFASEDDATIEITFMKLELLTLDYLSRLASFCGANCSFNFPSLKTVRVVACYMMKTFCEKNLAAPSLKYVSTGYQEQGRWDGDLNTTIRNIFAEEEKRKQRYKQQSSLQSSTFEDEGSSSSRRP